MPLQTWQELRAAQQGAGTLFNTYTSAKTVIPAQALYTIRGNSLYIGKAYRVTVLGALSNIVTTPGTVVMQIMVGGVIAFSTGAIQLNAAAHTLLPFWLEVILTCRAIGSGSASLFMGMGRLQGIPFTLTAGQVDAVNASGVYSAPPTAPAVGVGFDGTIDNVMDLWAGFSISNAGNGIQTHQYLVEELN